MKKHVTITLFGAAGTRTLNVTPRPGFPTRHVKAPLGSKVSEVSLPSESAPSVNPTPATPKPVPPVPTTSDAEVVDTPNLLEVLKWMDTSEISRDGWLIIDEILFVATAQYRMKFNQRSLLDALRLLYRKGCLAYRLNRFNQHTFRLIEGQETRLKDLLAEVDMVMGEGGVA